MNSETRTAERADLGSSIDPKEIWHALVRKKWLILASSLIVAGAAAAGTMRQPKVYSAIAQIEIEPAIPKVLGNDVALEELSARSRSERIFNNTQYDTITNRTMLRDVAQRLKLSEDADFKATYGLTQTGEALDKGIERVLRKMISVQPKTASRIVNLVVEDQDPYRATKIANTLGDAYIDHTLEERLETTRGASKFLEERVEEYAKKIEKAEAALHDFKEQHLLVDVSFEDRQTKTAESLGVLNTTIVQTRTKLIELQSKRSILQKALDGKLPIETVPRVAASEVIGELRSSLLALEKQRAEQSTRYGDKHPTMVAIDKQVEEAKSAIDAEIQVVIGTFDNEINALSETMARLEAEASAEKVKVIDLRKVELRYAQLTRDFGTLKTTYQNLLQRREEAGMSGQLNSSFVDWFQTAEPRLAPIRPSVPQNALIGLVAGLMIGVLIAMGGVLLDNTVHGQADIERLVNLPFLGVLPKIREDEEEARAAAASNPRGGARDLYILSHPKSGLAECARSIRTNLLFMGTEKPLSRLLLTSAGPAEGKTTTSINLGVTMAQAGNKVLLIDTDLRKPRLHRAFGVSGETGVSSVLVDAATLDEAIKSTDVVGLDVLPCGPLPPNPAELFHTDKFKALLEQIDERYDRVLLDSPPIGAVTDAAILSMLVHGTLVVVQANKTTKDAVKRAVRALRDVDTNIVGVVLNDFDVESGSYGYQQYYYYRGYGYGDSEEEAKA
ncbi:MAG: polysaccharide biosynthesis tyrosine autokinase [Deltaproteobacteria bacterium]